MTTDKSRDIKIGVTVGILFLTFACCYIPLLIRKKVKNSSLVMSYLNCLAGGVVLGTLLLHMIPHTFMSCEDSAPVEVEKVKCKHGHKHKHDHGHGHGHGHEHPDYHFGLLAAGLSFLFLFAIDRLFLTHSHCVDSSADATDVEKKAAIDNDHGSCHSLDLMGGCHMEGIVRAPSKIQAFVFVMALSLHSILEGLAMSTLHKYEALVPFVIGLLVHKWLEAFALGVNVISASFSQLWTFCLIAFYSILTPAGILLGMLINASSSNAEVSKVLNGLAAGSFLFVSCIEMIPPEFHRHSSHTKWKYLALLVGFGIMAGIVTLHSH